MRLLCAALLVALSVSPALAQREPEIVIPGRPDVPVYINGDDASWGIVEGEFGLDRPNEVNPTVIYRPFLALAPYPVPGYYPSDGRRPGYGRLEFVPPRNRPLRPPAPSYYRYWSSESAPGPVTEYSYPPEAVSPVIGGYRGRRYKHRSETNHQSKNLEANHPGEGRKDP
jgi:hypothetical protein